MDKNKVKGMLWGLIVGDAFGSPIQFSTKDGHKWLSEMEDCPVFNLPKGYWTDDGSMALCIIDSYIRQRDYDLKDIAQTFAKWYFDGYLSSVPGRSFDVGNATQESIIAFHRSGNLVNGSEESQGNGSIMRLAPSYLIARYKNNPAIMHEVSDLTHASARVRQVVDRFAKILDEHFSGLKTSEVSPYKTRKDVNNSGWAVSTLDAALWAFNTTDTFEKGLIDAVNLGGDSDTIGAVYGQLAGAYYGFDAIPSRWIREVKTYGEINNMIDNFISMLE